MNITTALATVKNATLTSIAFVKEKPNTVAYAAWIVGCYTAPQVTLLCSLFYTGWTLAGKTGDEWSEELEAALEKRAAEKLAVGTEEAAHVS